MIIKSNGRVIGTNPSTQQELIKSSGDGFLKIDTREHYEYNSQVRNFTNNIYGVNMNVDGYIGDISETVFDGVPATDWVMSVIQDNVNDFQFVLDPNNTADGTNSLSYTNGEDGDVVQFAKGSYLDLSDYSILNGWCYLTSALVGGVDDIQIYCWDTVSDSIVGNVINLSNYIDPNNLNVWQNFDIHLNNLGLVSESIDAIRIKVISAGSPPNGNIDNIQFLGSQSEGHYEYFLSPNIGEDLYVHELHYTIVGNFDNRLADATCMYLPCDTILGEPINNGILFRRWINNEISFSATWNCLTDILSSPTSEILTCFGDGSKTAITFNYKYASPTKLSYENGDAISIVIRDDLSGFYRFTVNANCTLRTERYY